MIPYLFPALQGNKIKTAYIRFEKALFASTFDMSVSILTSIFFQIVRVKKTMKKKQTLKISESECYYQRTVTQSQLIKKIMECISKSLTSGNRNLSNDENN